MNTMLIKDLRTQAEINACTKALYQAILTLETMAIRVEDENYDTKFANELREAADTLTKMHEEITR